MYLTQRRSSSNFISKFKKGADAMICKNHFASAPFNFYTDLFLFLIAAWAAANFAIGTRKGEQETYCNPIL